MRLVLFDIDGTLIRDGGASRQAFDSALRTVYGYGGDLAVYDFSGRTDPQIAFMVLRDAGYSDHEISGALPSFWRTYLRGLEQNLPGRVRALAGIPELVSELAAHSDVLLGLLTGNLEPGARLKLAGPDLNSYFPFGAFGSDSAKREELPPIAVQRAVDLHGQHFQGADVVIIGDSIYDVRCGVPWNATTIAVASGRTSGETLRAENPTFFFEDVTETAEVMAAILG